MLATQTVLTAQGQEICSNLSLHNGLQTEPLQFKEDSMGQQCFEKINIKCADVDVIIT